MTNEELCKQIIFKHLAILGQFKVKENYIDIHILNKDYVDTWENTFQVLVDMNKCTIELIQNLKNMGLNIHITEIHKDIICRFNINNSIEEILTIFKLYSFN